MLSDIEAELEREVRDLRAELIRERRARELRSEIGRLAAATSGPVSRSGVARVLADGVSSVFDSPFVAVAYVGDESMVRLTYGPGIREDIVAAWQEIPLDLDLPVCEILRGERRRVELTDRPSMSPWPVLAAAVESFGVESLAIGPIGDTDPPDAALLIGWGEQHLMGTAEAELFSLLSRLVAPTFERARRTESDEELSQAVQSWLREGALSPIAGFDVATLYEPGRDERRIGGDWFDVVELPEERAAVVIGDVVGHDVRAAIEMSQVRHVVASQLMSSGDPATALETTDRYLGQRSTNIMATALVATFDRDGSVSLASAGHPPPLLASADGTVRVAEPGLGPPLGTGIGGYSARSISVSSGDALVAYTDGVIEQRDESIDEGIERLRLAVGEVLASADPSPDAITRRLTAILDTSWRTDDAAAVVVRVAR